MKLHEVAARRQAHVRVEVANGVESVVEGTHDHGAKAAGQAQVGQAGLSVADIATIGVDADFVDKAGAQPAAEILGTTKAQTAVSGLVLSASQRERVTAGNGCAVGCAGRIDRCHAEIGTLPGIFSK